VFVLGYLAIFVTWYWWALGSENRFSAIAFVMPLFLVEMPVLLTSVLAMWLMHPPRRLRVWLYGVFLLLIGIELSVFGEADVNGLADIINGHWRGLLGYGSRMCLLTMAFFAVAWMATNPRR
jgi:hypothetical protein